METKMYTMGENGTLAEAVPCPELERGTIIIAVRHALESARCAITGKDKARGCYLAVVLDKVLSRDGAFTRHIIHVDKYCRPVSEMFGIGNYYDLAAPKADEGEILAALVRGSGFRERVEREKLEEARAWRDAQNAEREKYGDKYPECPDKWGNAVQVGKNIRKDLAEAFPGCKFSVRKVCYSAVRIAWTDGPTEKDVRVVVGKWEMAGEYDVCSDLFEHSDTAFTAVYGGLESLYLDREFSPEKMGEYMDKVERLCPGLPREKEVHFHDWNAIPGVNELRAQYGLPNNRCGSWFSCSVLARHILQETNLYQKPDKGGAKEQPAASIAPETETAPGCGCQILDYSEKAVAVVGDTKSIRETLKQLGGRFNPRLSCGAGWIFSKRQEAALRTALAL